MANYSLSYATIEEFQLRAKIFSDLNAEMEEFNASHTTSKVGHNQFSTFT
jgi:hypothetical protein